MDSAKALYFVILLALFGACGGKEKPRSNSGSDSSSETNVRADLLGKNVVLIVIDTLGAKHLGPKDNAPSPSPNLDRLAAEGIDFHRAYSPAPWTQPSMASLFTGRMPSSHGVQGLLDRLPPKEKTLAEHFLNAGYETHGAVTHFLVTERFGYHQGFRSYNEKSIIPDGLSSERLANHLIHWLEKRGLDRRQGNERPFFLFAHFFDPHSLYHHHPDFRRTPVYSGPVEPAMGVWDLRNLRPVMTPLDQKYLVELYREEIAYTDHHVGRVLEALERLELAPDTLICVTADHGEELLEHDWIGHTRTLYDELLRVPLFFHAPFALPARRIDEPVSTRDVFASLLDLCLGIEAPNGTGESLGPLMQGRDLGSSRPVFAEVSFSPHNEDARSQEKVAYKTAVITPEWKLIKDAVSGQLELYPAQVDPFGIEERNRFGSSREVDTRLLRLLEEFEGARLFPKGPEDGLGVQPSDEELKKLHGLGYVEGR